MERKKDIATMRPALDLALGRGKKTLARGSTSLAGESADKTREHAEEPNGMPKSPGKPSTGAEDERPKYGRPRVEVNAETGAEEDDAVKKEIAYAKYDTKVTKKKKIGRKFWGILSGIGIACVTPLGWLLRSH